MQKISKNNNVVPGAVAFYATPIYNISNIIDNQIYINDDNLVFQFDFANDSLSIDSNPVSNNSGELFQHNIEGTIPGQSPDNDSNLALIKQFRSLVIYRESDGEFYFIGSKHNGLKCTYTYSTGSQSKPKGYKINFTGLISPKSLPCSGVLDCKGVQIPL